MGVRTLSGALARAWSVAPVPGAVRRRSSLVWLALGALVAAEMIGDLISPSGRQAEFIFHVWLHDIVAVLAAVVCVARVFVIPHSRAAWAAIAGTLVTFAAGEVLWSSLYRDRPANPAPDITDAFYLAFYPFAITGLVLLTRIHVRRFEFHLWVDGIAIMLILATPGVAFLLAPVADHPSGDAFADAVNFAYPLLDLLLVGAVLGVYAITDWRPGACWAWLGAGFLLMTVPDSIATVQQLDGAGDPSHLGRYDFLWTIGMVAIAYAAWTRPQLKVRTQRTTGWRAIALPLLVDALAIGIQVFSFFHEIPPGGRSVTLAVLALSMMQTYAARPRRGGNEGSAPPIERTTGADDVPPDRLINAGPDATGTRR